LAENCTLHSTSIDTTHKLPHIYIIVFLIYHTIDISIFYIFIGRKNYLENLGVQKGHPEFTKKVKNNVPSESGPLLFTFWVFSVCVFWVRNSAKNYFFQWHDLTLTKMIVTQTLCHNQPQPYSHGV